MTSGILFTPPKYHQSYRALIAAKFSGYKLKEEPLPESLPVGYPCDVSPLFKSSDDVQLFGANAIAHFVGNDQLRGNTEQYRITQWVNWCDALILPSMATIVYPCLGITPYNKGYCEKAKDVLNEQLQFLDDCLSSRTFLVGERITQADISVFTSLLHLYEMIYDAACRTSFPHITRWFTTLCQQEEFIAVLGEVILCVKPAQYDSKKYAELHPKGELSSKKKLAEAKKVVSKVTVEEKKEPEKDPFASLTMGTFDMDEFKRTFSNNDILSIAVPYFWDKFDAENLSIWHCVYSYNHELTQIFMSCNLVGGFFQRLDKMRKHAFGSMVICGDRTKSAISGLWFWRGQDLAFKLHTDLQVDYEYYTWEKLDPKDEKTKKLVKDYFLQEGEFDGLAVADGKIFK